MTPPTETEASPIADFSQCHAGISTQLSALDALPGLLAPAERARQTAAATLAFFDDVILEHHAQEERELFPAVLTSAQAGAERIEVAQLVQRLSAEHRAIETQWAAIKGALRRVAKGQDADLDGQRVRQLVLAYRAHAGFEERAFLPLSQQILGRDPNHLAALGIALHLRHARPVAGYI